MEFTCNPVKNETNIRDRGLPLLAARVMFNSAMVVREDRERPTRSDVSSATTLCPVA